MKAGNPGPLMAQRAPNLVKANEVAIIYTWITLLDFSYPYMHMVMKELLGVERTSASCFGIYTGLLNCVHSSKQMISLSVRTDTCCQNMFCFRMQMPEFGTKILVFWKSVSVLNVWFPLFFFLFLDN